MPDFPNIWAYVFVGRNFYFFNFVFNDFRLIFKADFIGLVYFNIRRDGWSEWWFSWRRGFTFRFWVFFCNKVFQLNLKIFCYASSVLMKRVWKLRYKVANRKLIWLCNLSLWYVKCSWYIMLKRIIVLVSSSNSIILYIWKYIL